MVGLLRETSGTQGQIDEKNRRYARGIRYTSKKQREEYQNRVDEFFRTQMIYLTGEYALSPDSDYEDSVEALMASARLSPKKQAREEEEEPVPKDNLVEVRDLDVI